MMHSQPSQPSARALAITSKECSIKTQSLRETLVPGSVAWLSSARACEGVSGVVVVSIMCVFVCVIVLLRPFWI